MTLVDTGPLVALFDADDPHHRRCADALNRLPAPLITTWPCLTEAMHLLGRELGHAAQDDLWSWVEEDLLQLHQHQQAERTRMREMMRQYHDRPMDLGDASLMAAAEALSAGRVFSIDSDFYVYRTQTGAALEVVPGPLRTNA